MHIFVSGSLAYDRIMDFPGRFVDHILPEKIHILNVCFMVNGLTERFGGTAGNIAYNLALLGEKPHILATGGKDFGPYQEWLASLGLPLAGIRLIDEEFTAGAYITTDLADNQITGFNPGAMKHESEYHFDGASPTESLAIIAPGNLADMLVYSRRYKEMNLPYIFDPGQSIPAWGSGELKEMATGALAIIMNDYEMEMFHQKTGLTEGDLQNRAQALIITKGEEGSELIGPGGRQAIPPAKPLKVQDPTGAGDAYRAGLIKGLTLKLPWAAAALLGSTIASFAVEQAGTQEHQVSLADFRQRYQDNFGTPPL
jgi:adenosine kinase